MINFDMWLISKTTRRSYSCSQIHMVAIYFLLILTLLQELAAKPAIQQQSYYIQKQQQQQQQYIPQNPYGNIFGSNIPTIATFVTTTKRPNAISNSNGIQEKRPIKQPSRHPELKPTSSSSSNGVGENIVDRYNIRYPDGSYEFRYELADGTARYERGYFVRLDKLKSLIVVGYYSYRLSDGRYLTVFYNADQFGYRQNQSITSQTYPNLPRSIDVPQLRDDIESASQQK